MSKKKSSILPAPYDKSKLLHAFILEVRKICWFWDALNGLFVCDARRARAIREFSGELSEAVSSSLTLSVYLHIAHLNDPPTSMNNPHKRNLVLRRVIDDLAPSLSAQERSAIERDYKTFKPTADLTTKYRHSFGAHKDLSTCLAVVDHLTSARNDHPLPRIPIAKLSEAVNCLIRIAERLSQYHAPGAIWRTQAVTEGVEKFADTFRKAKDLLK